MIGQEFLRFLLPGSDIVQLVFFSIMVGLVFLTIILLYFQANPKTWEKYWVDKVILSEEGLDQELSSIQETSETVASFSEKLADFLPGIILVIGLLGTFLGIGVALNKASEILINSNIAGMDAAMTNLMSVMDGLGTKFKTSTWGLIAFLLLKFWTVIHRYDDKRLKWCVDKIKTTFGEVKREQQRHQDQLQNEFLKAIVNINDGINKEASSNRSMMKSVCEAINMQMELRNRKIITCFENSLQDMRVSLQDDAKLERNAIEDFSKNTQLMMKSVVNQGQLSLKNKNNLEEGISSVIHGLSELCILVENNNSHLEVQGQQQINELTKTRDSMQKFIELNSDNLQMIKSSAELMSKSAQGMGGSATNLQDAIDEFRKNIADVLGGIKTDLGSTIDMMGSSFSENMGQISQNMATATDGISSALTSLSSSVDTTMNDVKSSIDHSIQAQKKAQHEFIATSETLNIQVSAMTGLVEDLREKILSGLSAISSSNRQVASLNKRYEDISTQNERSAVAVENMVSQLQEIDQHNELLKSIENMSDNLREMTNHIHSSNNKLIREVRDVATSTELNKHLNGFMVELKDIKSFSACLEKISDDTNEKQQTLCALRDVLTKLNNTLSARSI